MTEPELPGTSFAASTGEAASPEPLQRQVQNLRALFVATLMALVLLSVGVNIFLWYQVRTVRKELKVTRAFIEDYQKNKDPLLNRLVSSLQSFAQDHPDLTPILEKYGIKPPSGQASQPVPAPTPAIGSTGR